MRVKVRIIIRILVFRGRSRFHHVDCSFNGLNQVTFARSLQMFRCQLLMMSCWLKLSFLKGFIDVSLLQIARVLFKGIYDYRGRRFSLLQNF